MDAFSHSAILIAAPRPGEMAMYCDQVAMAEALLGRGFQRPHPVD